MRYTERKDVTHQDFQERLEREYERRRPGRYAGYSDHRDGAHLIKEGYHWNGSGAQAFGGARSWPVVTTETLFQTGREDIAKEFADALAEFTELWLSERNL